LDAQAGIGYIGSGYANPLLIPDLYNNSDIRTARISYMRVRALNVQYNLPSAFVKRVRASSATVYFSAQNLWYVVSDKDKLNGVEPEVVGERVAMPIPRIFNLGVNISF